MRRQTIWTIAISLALAGAAAAQQRTASFTGRGEGDRGKCTIEVVVDGVAQVEIRGDNASLRTISGQTAQWRRFVCSGPVPTNPPEFRFSGVDGRGRQTLIRDPRNGGPAVVQIEDPQGGSEGYTFDITWANGPVGGRPDFNRPPDNRPPDRGYRPDGDRRDGGDADAYYRTREDRFRGNDWRRRFFQQVRQDLEHVQAVTFPVGGDQFRLARTRQQLDELQDKLAAGRYDERELDDVIVAMRRVLQDNRMSRRDHDILADDLDRLRDFRDRHEDWGARGPR